MPNNSPTGSVAAENHNASNTKPFHFRSGRYGVLRGSSQRYIQQAAISRQLFISGKVFNDCPADLKGVRHKPNRINTHCLSRQHDPLDNIDLFLIVNRCGVGNQSADILSRSGICDDTNTGHSTPPLRLICLFLCTDGLHDILSVRQISLLQNGSEGNRRIQCANADDGAIQ